MPQVGRNRTLYASDGDEPAWLSAAQHAYLRAGYLPPVAVAHGLDAIDASHVDKSFLGHSYFAIESLLLNDVFSLRPRASPTCRKLMPCCRSAANVTRSSGCICWNLLVHLAEWPRHLEQVIAKLEHLFIGCNWM